MAAATGLTLLGLAACTGATAQDGDDPAERAGTVAEEQVAPLSVRVNVPTRDVPVDSLVAVNAAGGTLDDVSVFYGAKPSPARSVDGELTSDGTGWKASSRLEPGKVYTVTARGTRSDGQPVTKRQTFRTAPLTLDQQTYPSFVYEGQTVGVGMPVIVKFDVPVTDRAAIERHLSVEAKPAIATGSWHWVSDYEVHYRPKAFWKPGTKVTVHADINGVDAGNGIYGQMDRTGSFTVGDAVISKIDLQAHTLKVYRNGTLLRTIPVTGGKPGFETRSGTKVIIEKFESKRMDAATTGISPSDPEYYNIANVQYAMRVTYSGEFLHAAPWSVGSQGYENVSHACVGMSTENAAWLYSISKVGDVVKVTGSSRTMEEHNGWTDWDQSFAEYREGSALT